jgi:hypothetical protein
VSRYYATWIRTARRRRAGDEPFDHTPGTPGGIIGWYRRPSGGMGQSKQIQRPSRAAGSGGISLPIVRSSDRVGVHFHNFVRATPPAADGRGAISTQLLSRVSQMSRANKRVAGDRTAKQPAPDDSARKAFDKPIDPRVPRLRPC